MKKIINLTMVSLIALIFVGCGSSVKTCKDKGYKGVVITNSSFGNYSSNIYCSNGDKTKVGSKFMTNGGEVLQSTHMYLPFP